ncbi:hypothetical protein EV122DRAFT_252489, partial [Schizophyllum commune]
ASNSQKNRKLTPNALRAAREALDDGREGWEGGGGGAKRRHVSRRLEGRKIRKSREMRRGPRGNPSLKAATQGEGGGGREAALSTAGDAGNAKPSSSASSSHELRKSTRLYLLPRLVNIFIRRFHVATSSKSKPPISLKQRIFVCRAAISSLQMRCPLRPSPHIGPPLIPTSPPTPLGVEAIYRRPPSEDPSPSPPPSALDCATLLVLNFPTLFELPAPRATPSILVSTNFNMPRGLGADAHPPNVVGVEGILSAVPLAPFLDAARPLSR